jgi:hypothetical protein
MMPNVTVPAATLADAFVALNHRQPLQPEELDALFVSRPESPTPRIQTQLQLTPEGPKILFVGHMGSGKSTELTYLARQLTERFISVQVPIYEIYQKPDINHTELIYAMTLRLIKAATDESVVPRGVAKAVWEKLLEDAYLRLKQGLVGEQPVGGESPGPVTVKLSYLAAELETRIGTEDATRRQVKEQYANSVSELIEQINRLSDQMKRITNKHVLLWVDGLEKFDLEDMRELFVKHGKSLLQPRPAIIYTFPVAMRYTDDFTFIQRDFDRVEFLPNFGVSHRDGTPDEAGRAKLAEIVMRRVDPKLYQEGILDEAVVSSGGHVKTLLQLLQQATLEAVVDQSDRVGSDHLQRAVRRLRDAFMVMLRKDDYVALRQVRVDSAKDLIDAEGERKRLLYNGSLLEYGNTRGPWTDVNPIVTQLLDVLDEEAQPVSADNS